MSFSRYRYNVFLVEADDIDVKLRRSSVLISISYIAAAPAGPEGDSLNSCATRLEVSETIFNFNFSKSNRFNSLFSHEKTFVVRLLDNAPN